MVGPDRALVQPLILKPSWQVKGDLRKTKARASGEARACCLGARGAAVLKTSPQDRNGAARW